MRVEKLGMGVTCTREKCAPGNSAQNPIWTDFLPVLMKCTCREIYPQYFILLSCYISQYPSTCSRKTYGMRERRGGLQVHLSLPAVWPCPWMQSSESKVKVTRRRTRVQDMCKKLTHIYQIHPFKGCFKLLAINIYEMRRLPKNCPKSMGVRLRKKQL